MEDVEPYGRLLKAMQKQSEEDQVFLHKATTAIEELNLHNSIYAEQIIGVAKLLTTFTIATVEDPAAELELDRDRGMSVNLAAAMRCLNDYSAPLREGGEQMVELDRAILAIFREKERRILNEI